MIRIGYFDDFKGADTLLIESDQEGLQSLVDWLRLFTVSGTSASVDRCPGAKSYGVNLTVEVSQSDIGMKRASNRQFKWIRSAEGWADVVDKLLALHGSGHQYLDGPADDIQIMAAVGEYGDAWWASHGEGEMY